MATARRPSSLPTARPKQSWPSSEISRTGRAGESHPRRPGRDLHRSIAGVRPECLGQCLEGMGLCLVPDRSHRQQDTSSWKLACLVMTAGLRGILFPSLRHAGGTNLLIFPANLVEGDHVAVHDPDHRLPHDQSSWS
ncbi:RES domain-containing protein [Mesorhizobium sp. LNHC209A00]